MLALAMALISSAAWGTADFIGGMAARRISLSMVLLGTSIGGGAFAALVVAVSGQPPPPVLDLALGAAAGLAGLAGLAAFYRALAIGKMSVVAPISATGTAIPVSVGIAGGDPVGALMVSGFVLTIGGVMLASREQQVDLGAETDPGADAGIARASDERRSIPLALAAAVGFGLVYVLIARAGESSELWPVLMVKSTAALVMAAVVAVAVARGRSAGARPRGAQWTPLIVVGLLDVTAISTYAYASTHGPLSVTAVLASLFPVVTVLLAHRILGERLILVQRAGVAMALVGVVLLAAA